MARHFCTLVHERDGAMRVCGLVAAAVALGLGFPAEASADITFFTDRAAWERAAGPPSFTEDFSGFSVDTPFRTAPAALNGMAIQQVGTERMAWNEVDVPPPQFAPNSGSSSRPYSRSRLAEWPSRSERQERCGTG